MDFRLCMLLQGLSLLLLLVHASCSCSKTSRDSPTSSPQHQHHHHVQHHQQHHRPSRQLQRQSRGLSEFLVPPPAPANFRGPRGPPSLPPPKNNNHNQPPPPPLPPPPLSPPPPPQHTRNGRYVNQQGGNGGNNNNGPGYFSKLMDWLNPFTGGGNGNNNDAIGKDSVGLGGSNYPKLQLPPPQPPVAQYAPQQPYTGGTGQYEPPPHPGNLQNGYSNLAPWMNGKPCNPCNQIPWIPVLGASSQHNSDPGQYAANVGGGRYLPPPPPQEVKTPDFSHSVPPSKQQNYPIPNPHLYPGVMPPLFKAEPFNVAPAGYQPPNLDQPHSPNFEQAPPGLDHQPLQNFDHPPPPNFNQQPLSHFDQSSPSNYNHPPPANFNQQPSSHFDKSRPNLDHPPQSNYNQPPPNINHPPQSNYNQAPNNLNHPPQQNFELPSPPNFDHPPPPNFNHKQSPQNIDHPPDLNFDYASSNSNHPPLNFDQQPSEIIEDHPPPNFDHQSQNYDYNGGSDYGNQHSSNDDDQHPPSNFEQHHQPSQIVDVVKEAPTDLDHSDISDHHHQEPVHAESRPVYVNSAKSSSSPNDIDQQQHHRHRPTAPSTPNYQESHKIVHFQRSPLIDLSNIGESPSTTTTAITTTTPSSSGSSSSGSNRFLDSRPTDHIPVTIVPSKGKHSGESATLPSATLIDYIVSGADAESFSSSEEEKETRSPPRLQNERNALVLPSATTTTTTTTTSSTTTQRVMTRPVDQRRQESLIETLVQSYEFFKKRNNETLTNEVRAGGRFYNETEDSSASREVVVPSKSENGKKIIQIIIPYTSQYTPSPFHSTKSVKGHHHNHIDSSAAASNHPGDSEDSESHDDNVEDNVVIQESRRVSVTRMAPKDDLERLRNVNKTASAPGNSIDVHRLQKNIDNWTIQEYSKPTTSVTNSPNSTYPRWLSSKQIPDEYLLSTTEYDDSNESYDFSKDTELHRRTNKSEVTPTTSTHAPDSVTIVEAIYPKNPKKTELPPKRNSLNTSKNLTSSEKVYVVTPVPNPNSLEDLDEASSKDSSSKSSKSRKSKNKEPVERAYQVLPQAVNSLAVLANAPESAAPALWGIMEHEEFAQSADQPRWRSDADELPEPASTPILYSGHSKVSRAR